MPQYRKSISHLYELCTELRLLFNALGRDIESTEEIGMNASVATGHLDRQARSAVEIAHQIVGTGRRMRKYGEELRVVTNNITSHTLSMLIRTTRLEKYRDTLKTVKGDSNIYLVKNVIAAQIRTIQDMSDQVQHTVHRANATLKNLEKCHQRLFVTQSALEIESVELERSKSLIIMSLVERLNTMSDQSVEKIQRARVMLRNISQIAINISEFTQKEHTHENTHAA